MMDKIVIGKYLNRKSFFHSLDPRFKLAILFLLMVSILLPTGWWFYGVLAIVCLVFLKLANLSISYVLKLFKPMLIMMIFLLVINLLNAQGGIILFKLGSFPVHLNAFVDTFYIVVRLLLMLSITSIVTATTKPLELTIAIEDLLKPLNYFKIPSHIIAMIISIALRFIPTLIEEVNRIMKAQASRGVDYEHGNFITKVKSMFSLIIPLFEISFKRATELAEAMDARGYRPDGKRTRYHQFKPKMRDYLILGLVLVLLIVQIGVMCAL